MDCQVRNAAQAIQAVLAYLETHKVPNAPRVDIKWKEKTLYSAEPTMDYAVTSKQFISGKWIMEVSQGVAPLSRTVYQVTIFNAELHWYWKGSVKADGDVTEAGPFRPLSEVESRKMAEEFLKKSQVPPPRPGGYGH